MIDGAWPTCWAAAQLASRTNFSADSPVLLDRVGAVDGPGSPGLSNTSKITSTSPTAGRRYPGSSGSSRSWTRTSPALCITAPRVLESPSLCLMVPRRRSKARRFRAFRHHQTPVTRRAGRAQQNPPSLVSEVCRCPVTTSRSCGATTDWPRNVRARSSSARIRPGVRTDRRAHVELFTADLDPSTGRLLRAAPAQPLGVDERRGRREQLPLSAFRGAPR